MKSRPTGSKTPGHRSPQRSAQHKKLFIVENHPIFREELRRVLKQEKDLTVIGATFVAADALEAIARLDPDLVLVDISFPGRSGMQFIKELRKVNRQVKVLVISMRDEAAYADRVLRAGADGYIMKQEDPEEVASAIHDVLAGHIYISEAVLANRPKGSSKNRSKATARPMHRLTDSELEILELLGRGKTADEISRLDHLSVEVLKRQCDELRGKLNLRTTNELSRYAVCWVEKQSR